MKRRKSLRCPSIETVARDMRETAQVLAREYIEVDDVDFRLQVHADGSWRGHWGPSDYDQDHRGFWGASSLPSASEPLRVFREVARDLLDQVREHFAQSTDVFS